MGFFSRFRRRQAQEPDIHRTIPVLDHGFVRLVDRMGDDSAIVQAARVSYGDGTKTVREDEALIRYLMRHWHTTPFEMCEIKLHLKMPIFVARQWIRHRTANVNEYSARYSEMSDEFYIPDEQQVLGQNGATKQAGGGELPRISRMAFRMMVRTVCSSALDRYRQALKMGVARETSRVSMPLNSYTEMYWKVDLHNLLHFLRLRADHHAQWEIRQYADVILNEIVKQWVPATYRAFLDYRLNAHTFSAQEMKVLRAFMTVGTKMTIPTEMLEALSKRELNEFCSALGIEISVKSAT